MIMTFFAGLQMKELSSDYLVRMLGGCFENLNNCLITEYCSRGSLQDVLENDELQLDDMFKYSLLHDIVKVDNFCKLILIILRLNKIS